MADSKINILFPIETINRELDFRLFLAVYFADATRRIFIGQHDVIDSLVPGMQGGVYVGKNLFKSEFISDAERPSLKCYNKLKERGFSVVHLDEEGSIYPGDEAKWKQTLDRRLDIEILRHDDYVCTWGEFSAKHYSAMRPEFASNIRVTGHPRFDIYKTKYSMFYGCDAATIKRRYGRYILLNMNLTRANNIFGLKDTFSKRLRYEVSDDDKRIDAIRAWEHSSKMLGGFVLLAHRLSIEFKDISIIVRPHPSESMEFYETVFKGVNNIHVIHSGSVGPWIVGSEVLIHNGCTTAIEAYISDKPVISYLPVIDESFDVNIANQFGIKCLSEEDVVFAVGEILDGRYEMDNIETNTEALDLLYNLKGDSFRCLIRVMEEAQGGIMKFKSPGFLCITFREVLRAIESRLRMVARSVFPGKIKKYNSARFLFYGFDSDIIGRKLDFIQGILGKKIKYRGFGESLIVIEAEGQPTKSMVDSANRR